MVNRGMIRLLTLASGARDRQITIIIRILLSLGRWAAIRSPDSGSKVAILGSLALE